MSRVRRAYEALFRSALLQLGARRPDEGVRWLHQRAQACSQRSQTSLTRALVRTHARLSRQVAALQAVRERMGDLLRDRSSDAAATRVSSLETVILRDHGVQTSRPGVAQRRSGDQPALGPSSNGRRHQAEDREFLCDAGLGGLTRWLRAAGYKALWDPDVDDAALIRAAQRSGATLLTTDSLLMERRLIRTGEIRALWLPPELTIHEQLLIVFETFGLTRRPVRCMRCGGELERVDKAAVWDRIPPRTRLWLDTYFRCRSCDQLFWHGTHWSRIQGQLEILGAVPTQPCE